jgi:hypothetical protein
MVLLGSRGETTSAPVQNVQVVQSVPALTSQSAFQPSPLKARSSPHLSKRVPALTSVLPRDAGEDKGGGLNDWNFLNELNACQGTDLLPRSGELGSRSPLCVNNLGSVTDRRSMS